MRFRIVKTIIITKGYCKYCDEGEKQLQFLRRLSDSKLFHRFVRTKCLTLSGSIGNISSCDRDLMDSSADDVIIIDSDNDSIVIDN